jgi:hypothetical protein
MTEYRLASTPKEYKECHDLLDLLGRVAGAPLSIPTICAYRGDKLVGFISIKNPKKTKAIVINEIAVHPDIKSPIFLLVKLVDIMDRFLADRGIVSYYFSVPLDMPHYIARIKQVAGLDPYTKDSKVAWFVRRIA